MMTVQPSSSLMTPSVSGTARLCSENCLLCFLALLQLIFVPIYYIDFMLLQSMLVVLLHSLI